MLLLLMACAGSPEGAASDTGAASVATPPALTASSEVTETTPATSTATSSGRPATTTGDTGIDSADSAGDTGGQEVAVSCARGASPLIVTCTVELSEPAPVTLELSSDGAPTRIFSTAAAERHELTGWGLKPLTTYTWSLAGHEGEVQTGPLPWELRDVDLSVSGTLFGMDALLVYVSCGWFLMVDGEGDIVWAEPTDVYDELPDGMAWSQADRSVLAVRDSTMSLDESVFSEIHVSGEEVLRLEPDVHFTRRLTHDVARWGPYTYLLGERDGIAGFEVWEGTTLIGDYGLEEDFGEVEGLSRDHANGITVTSAGEVVISVLAFDAVVAVDGDPRSPTFLQRTWHASGAPGGPADDLPEADYAPRSGEVFVGQHNASRHGDDLWVFDNFSDGFSRAVRLRMDHEAGLLIDEESWSMLSICPNQGGAIPVEGGVLTTCANAREAKLFRHGEAEPAFALRAACPGAARLEGFTRAFPVQVE